MIALTNAIAAKYNTTSALTTALPGGMFMGRTKVGVSTFPYVVVQVESSPTQSSFGTGNHYNSVAVRFVVYGEGHDATGTACATLDSNYNDTILTLASGQCVNCYRMFEPRPVLQPEVDESGQDVWAWVVTYVYSVRN
jgi:hypothetical protein